MKLFSLDSPIGRAIAMMADLVILNLLFMFSCMPIVTVGAACGALYDTVNAMLLGGCGNISQHYFAGFRKCFLRGTVLFLISGAVIVMVVLDLLLALQVGGIMGLLCTGVILTSLIIVLAVMAHLPMLLCRDPEEKLLTRLRDGLLLALKNSWRTVVAVVLNVLPFVLFLFIPAMFVQTWMFWFLIGFSAIACVNNWLLLKGVAPEIWERIKPVKKET